VSLVLFRIMIPVIIAVKVLDELGLVSYIAAAFRPLMGLLGLPGEMGLVWATAVVTNMYGGIVTFAAIAPGLGMSTAQITVVASLILIAHSMPVETTIARKTGVRLRFMIPFRLICAFVLGMLLNLIFSMGNLLQGPGRIMWNASGGDGGPAAWGLSQLKNLLTIFLIVLTLIVLMKVLDRLGITRFMNRLLAPVLTSMGIGTEASTVTILGMILGISYGGGLIIRDVRSGRISPRDVFFSMALMGLSHAIIEDSLLMMSLGASIFGVLLGRVLFSWLVIFLLVQAVGRMKDETFYRFLFRRPR